MKKNPSVSVPSSPVFPVRIDKRYVNQLVDTIAKESAFFRGYLNSLGIFYNYGSSAGTHHMFRLLGIALEGATPPKPPTITRGAATLTVPMSTDYATATITQLATESPYFRGVLCAIGGQRKGKLNNTTIGQFLSRLAQATEPNTAPSHEKSIEPADLERFISFFFDGDGWTELGSYRESENAFVCGNVTTAYYFQRPLALFGRFGDTMSVGRRGTAMTELTAVLAELIGKEKIPQDVVAGLNLLPEVLTANATWEIPVELIQVLYANLALIYQLNQKSPQAELQALLKLSPEFSYRLLAQVQANGSQGGDQQGKEIFSSNLECSPRWGYRTCQAFPWVLQFETLCNSLQENAEIEAEAKLFQCFLRGKTLSLEERLELYKASLPITKNRIELLVLMLRKFPALIFDVIPVVEYNKDAFAYHVLHHVPGVSAEAKAQLYEMLTGPDSLPWAMQYCLEDKNAPREILAKARANCQNRFFRKWASF